MGYIKLGKKKRIDSNQNKIIAALQKRGATVLRLARLGKGCPDLMVGYQKKNYLLEVKNGSLCPSKQKLTKDEKEFMESWGGYIAIVNSEEAAVNAIVQSEEVSIGTATIKNP